MLSRIKSTVVMAILAVCFPSLLLSEMNPSLKINPIMEKKISDIKKVSIKKYPEQIKSFTFSKDKGPWKYNLQVENPKKSGLLVEIYAKNVLNKETKIASDIVSGLNHTKAFENKQYKSLRAILYKRGTGITVTEKKRKVDESYVNLPKIKSEIVSLSVSSNPKSWSFSIKNTTSVPMEFSYSLYEKEGTTNHGILNSETNTIGPNQIFEKSGKIGFLKVGNILRISVRNTSTEGVLASKEVLIK